MPVNRHFLMACNTPTWLSDHLFRRASGLSIRLLSKTLESQKWPKLHVNRLMGESSCNRTASRDLSDLVAKGVIVPLPSGDRTTRYELSVAKPAGFGLEKKRITV
jgi:hypothetical protein